MKAETSSHGSVVAKAARWLAVTALATVVATAMALATAPTPTRAPALENPPEWVDQTTFHTKEHAILRWKDKWGQSNGPIVIFWESGGVKIVGFHRNGVMHGWWAGFNESGDGCVVTEYDNGEIVGQWLSRKARGDGE
jgi:hypothetical protein